MKALTYYIEKDSPLISYVFETVFYLIGIKSIKVKELNIDIDIYYGNEFHHYIQNFKIIIPQNKNHIIWSDVLNNTNFDYLNTNVFKLKFDLINAIGEFLTDKVNDNF